MPSGRFVNRMADGGHGIIRQLVLHPIVRPRLLGFAWAGLRGMSMQQWDAHVGNVLGFTRANRSETVSDWRQSGIGRGFVTNVGANLSADWLREWFPRVAPKAWR